MQDICIGAMSSLWPFEVVECDFLVYLHLTDVALLRGISKTIKNAVDSRPDMWRNGLQNALPDVHLSANLFEQLEEMSALMKLYTLLARVTVVNEPKIIIKTKDELPLLARLLSSGNRIAGQHASKCGMTAGLYLFCLKFHNINEPACIDIPLTPDLCDAVNADGSSLRLHMVLKNGKVKWMIEGLRQTTGAIIDMNIRCPAVTLTQHIRISGDDSPTMWRPGGGLGFFSLDTDVCAFLGGIDKAKQALSEGVLCMMCLRDPLPQSEQSRPSMTTHKNALCLDVVHQEKYVASRWRVNMMRNLFADE